jgi:hypothetical protein
LLHRRAWEFLVRLAVQETTHSHLRRAWVVLVHLAQALLVQVVHVRLVPVALVALVVQVVPGALVVQVVSQVAHVLPVLVSSAPAALRVPVALQLLADSHAQAVALVVAVAVLAAELRVPSVRVAHAVRARLASQSVRSAKNSNREAMLHHLVARLFHAVTARP